VAGLLCASQGLMNGRLEATNVLNWGIFRFCRRARPQVLVQRCEDLRVQHLKAPNAIDHPLELLRKRKNKLFSVDFDI